MRLANGRRLEANKRLKEIKFGITWKEYRNLELDPAGTEREPEHEELTEEDSFEEWV